MRAGPMRPLVAGHPPGGRVSATRWPGLHATEEELEAWYRTREAERARDRAGRERRDAVRKPPPPPFKGTKGVCSLCGAALTGRRTSWCSDACVELWFIATTPSNAHGQLVAIHGRGCWACGATTRNGERLDDWRPVEERLVGPPAPWPVELEVDHIRPLWSLTDGERTELRWWLPFNLQLLCPECHKTKTKAEAALRAHLRATGLPWRGASIGAHVQGVLV